MHVAIDGIDEHHLILPNLIRTSDTITDLLQQLRQLHISHLLVNTAEMNRLARKYLGRENYFAFTTAKDQRILEQLFSPQSLRILQSQHGVILYEILYPPM